MFKKWKKIAIECSAAALLMSTLFTASFAWFTAQNKADLGDGEGFTAAAYFDGGNGSEENPYIINRPIHLYNLAWLQYLGYFNKTDGSGNLIQKHFVLTGDLDMAGWTLPAIGTTDNPFMGTFTGDPGDQSGNYYVVKNLTVDNQLGEGHIDHKPSVVTSLTGVNIVGMFGVVGNYEGLYSASTFSTAANFIQDFYLDQATIHSQLSATLMGVAAGYVNAPVAGVGVSNSKLNVAPGSNKFRADLTSNISDYTTIGYCTADYKGTRSIRKTNVQAGTTGFYYFSSLSSGASDAWGGSIDFSSVYSRLKIYQRDSSANSNTLNTSGWISSETQTIDGTTTTVTNQVAYPAGQIKNYYDSSTPLKGSYSFDYYSSGTLEAGTSDSSYDYIYLYGKKTWTKTTTTRQVNSGSSYAISYGSNYLIPSGTTGVTNTSTLTYSWKFSNFSGSGTISTTIGSTTYYLKYGSSSGTRYLLAIGTSSPTTWTRTGNLTTTTIGGRAYYLEYSTTYGWDLSRTSMNLVYSPSSTTNTVQTTTLGETNDTYFPLNVGSDGLPADTNTGYIIGGSTYNAST